MLKKIANTIRSLTIDAVEHAGSGHPGLPMGCAELGAFLFAEFLRYHPDSPKWRERDRVVLSAGLVGHFFNLARQHRLQGC